MRDEIDLGSGMDWFQFASATMIILLLLVTTGPVGTASSYLWGEAVPECELITGVVVETHNYTDEGHNVSEEPWIHSNWAILVQVEDGWAGTSSRKGVWVSESIWEGYQVGDDAVEIICEVQEHQSFTDLIENMTKNGWLWNA